MTEKLQTVTARHEKLIRAQSELRRLRDDITADVAPQAAKSIRGALTSVDAAIRQAERLMAEEMSGENDALKWERARSGSHWKAGPWVITTYAVNDSGTRVESGYALYHDRQVVARARTWSDAVAAAERIRREGAAAIDKIDNQRG